MADILIRPAVADDLPAVRALLVETWHDTYDALLGAERVTEITNAWHSVENLGRQLDIPGTSFLVAEENGRSSAMLLANAEKPPLLVLSRLYVRPDRQRRGIGTQLLEAIIRRHPKSMRLRLEVEGGNAKGPVFLFS